MRKIALMVALFTLMGSGLSACGGDDETGANGETQAEDLNPETDALTVAAAPDGSLAYEQESLEATAGNVTVTLENDAPIAHDFCIEGPGGEELGCTSIVADGDTTTQQFDLEPGEYTFYCSVAGHREDGMEGPLTVE